MQSDSMDTGTTNAYYNARLDNIESSIERIELANRTAVSGIQENIDRLEQIMLDRHTRGVNYPAIIGAVFTFIALAGSFGFGLVSLQDVRVGQLSQQMNSVAEKQTAKQQLFDEFRAEMHYEIGVSNTKDDNSQQIIAEQNTTIRGLDSRVRDLEMRGEYK